MAKVITTNDAQYALDIVKEICEKVGPGLPSSPQERERAAILRSKLASHLGKGNVAVEDFTIAPGSAIYGPPISALFTLVAALLNISVGHIPGISPLVTAIAALVISIVSPLLFIIEFIYAFEFVDIFYKKKISENVIGTLRKPGTKQVKRLLIVSGHHDSAPENVWFRYLGYGFFFLSAVFFLGFIVLLVMTSIQFVGVVINNAAVVRTGTLGWLLLAFPIMPCIIYLLFMNRGLKNGGTVPGAADNLSGSALAVAICRFLVRNPTYIPADTEIRFISFGSEEAGLRGSRRYVKSHMEELKRLDVRLLNFETVAHPEIRIITTDVNGTVKNSPEMVRSAVAAAKRAGVPYKVVPASIGVITDAGPFNRAGLKATTLLPFKIPQQLFAFYHQVWDKPEVLTIDPLLNVLKLTLEWIRNNGE